MALAYNAPSHAVSCTSRPGAAGLGDGHGGVIGAISKKAPRGSETPKPLLVQCEPADVGGPIPEGGCLPHSKGADD